MSVPLEIALPKSCTGRKIVSSEKPMPQQTDKADAVDHDNTPISNTLQQADLRNDTPRTSADTQTTWNAGSSPSLLHPPLTRPVALDSQSLSDHTNLSRAA